LLASPFVELFVVCFVFVVVLLCLVLVVFKYIKKNETGDFYEDLNERNLSNPPDFFEIRSPGLVHDWFDIKYKFAYRDVWFVDAIIKSCV
jgi:hypothetical protein